MPIDPRIALGYQAPQLESPVNMMMMAQKMQSGQQENQLRQAQMENVRSEIDQRNALLPSQLDKATRDAATAQLTQDEKTFEIANKRYKTFQQVTGALANKPNVTKDDAIAAARGLVAIGMLDQDKADAMLGQLPDEPFALQAALKQSTMQQLTPEQLMTLFAPKPDKINAGGYTRVVDLNPNSPTYKQTIADVQHTLSPDAATREARLAKSGINSDSYPLVAQALLDGRIPPGVNSRNAAIYESALGLDPEADLSAISTSQVAERAGARTAGTASANIAIASDEASRMINVTRQFISAVNPTEFPSLNAVKNAVQKGTGDQNIVRLNTSLNALINSYARAINPRGQPTVSDKNHARDIINSAMSEGQLGAALDVMKLEMDAALKAATAQKGGRGAAGGETPVIDTPQGIPSTDAIAAEIARRKAGKK
jgi:hypothetical protein